MKETQANILILTLPYYTRSSMIIPMQELNKVKYKQALLASYT